MKPIKDKGKIKTRFSDMEASGQRTEWICKHGIGHHQGVHGCDGCCAGEPEMEKTTKDKKEIDVCCWRCNDDLWNDGKKVCKDCPCHKAEECKNCGLSKSSLEEFDDTECDHSFPKAEEKKCLVCEKGNLTESNYCDACLEPHPAKAEEESWRKVFFKIIDFGGLVEDENGENKLPSQIVSSLLLQKEKEVRAEMVEKIDGMRKGHEVNLAESETDKDQEYGYNSALDDIKKLIEKQWE